VRDGVHIERWGDEDLPLLTALNGDPAQMAHVGGAETVAKIAERQRRYAADPFQFRVVDEETGAGAGWVGFWPTAWHGEPVFEIGWSILPAFQGRGLATAATDLAIAAARTHPEPRAALHAFPGVDNLPSNAVCRRLDFTLVAPSIDIEYPPGSTMVANDWRLEL
jgi:RimJ/RimL family protein N-acetyltransferase